MVLSVTGGLLLKTPAMFRDRATVSSESVTSSLSVLLSWRYSVMVTLPLLVAFCFVLVKGLLVFAFELVGVAVVVVGSLKLDGISPLCWAFAGFIIGLWLTTEACNMVVTSVTA